MTTPIETLRDAVEQYARIEFEDGLIVTDFAIALAAIDMHRADTETFVGTASHGARHATIGLAHILACDLMEGTE